MRQQETSTPLGLFKIPGEYANYEWFDKNDSSAHANPNSSADEERSTNEPGNQSASATSKPRPKRRGKSRRA